MEKNNSLSKKSIDFVAVIIVFVIVGVLGAWLILDSTNAVKTVGDVKASSIKFLTPYFLWLGLACLVYLLYFSFSKYGHIRFGNGKPEFKTFNWLVMMFCAGMGSSMMLWSVIEPLYYLSGPPMGAKPMSDKAFELAGTYGIYHWTFIAWALFAVGAIPLCYRFYILKKPGLSLSVACEGVLGEKVVRGPIGKIIEIIVVFGILGGHGTTLVLGIPMIQNNVANLFGVPDTLATGIILIAIVTALFMISSWLGLDKGMQNLSKYNAYFAIALAVYFLAVGPTIFQLEVFTNAMGYMANNFPMMSLWTDPIAQGGFPGGWTAFYWAWWLALGPWMWIFTTRISKGRTLKEVMLGMLLAGSAGCMLYFGAIGGYTLDLQRKGMDLVGTLSDKGPSQTITDVVLTLPLGKVILFIWAIIAVIFLATTLDSSSYTLAATTTKGLKQGENPARLFKLFWALMLAVVPCSLLYANADLTAFQSMAVLTATPISIFTIIALIGGAKWIFRDYSHLSREQIILQENKKITLPEGE